MDIKGKIASVLSLGTMLVFLAASSGIAVIKHSCHHCGDKTYITGFNAGRDTHSHSCCSNGGGCHSEHTQAPAVNTAECCDVEVTLFKVSNYIPEYSAKVLTLFQDIVPPVNFIPVLKPVTPVFFADFNTEKHAGPPIYKITGQLLI